MCKDVADALAPGRAHRSVQPGVPELVVDATLLVVRQDLVGLVDLFELGLGRGVPRVSVGVVLQRFAPVRLAKLVSRCLARDAQDFVVFAL